MTTNRLGSVPANVLSGERTPNAIAGFGRPAMAPPQGHVLRLPAAGVGVFAAMLALLVALLVALFGGHAP